MRLRLKTKFTLTTAVLVLTVVGLVSVVSVAALVRQTIRQLDDRAQYVAQLILGQAQHALDEAAARGMAPASASEADLEAYVRDLLRKDSGIAAALSTALAYSPTIYEVSVVNRESEAIVSSDPERSGHLMLPGTRLERLTQADFLEQLRALYGPSRIYELSLPFNVGDQPFGEIRVDMNSALLRNEISPTLRAATQLACSASCSPRCWPGSPAASPWRRCRKSPRSSTASPTASLTPSRFAPETNWDR